MSHLNLDDIKYRAIAYIENKMLVNGDNSQYLKNLHLAKSVQILEQLPTVPNKAIAIEYEGVTEDVYNKYNGRIEGTYDIDLRWVIYCPLNEDSEYVRAMLSYMSDHMELQIREAKFAKAEIKRHSKEMRDQATKAVKDLANDAIDYTAQKIIDNNGCQIM
jgi:NADH:ubiquinone oxidoreductase subunit